jgi:hypothetical protein
MTRHKIGEVKSSWRTIYVSLSQGFIITGRALALDLDARARRYFSGLSISSERNARMNLHLII